MADAPASRVRQALVLCAGLGTRLRPLSLLRAKPALPVAGEPLARRIVRWLASSGVTELVMNLHHLPASIAGVVGDGSDLGAHMRYSWEQPDVLGSAGGPRHALDIVGSQQFFVINGDTLTNVNLAQLANAHAHSGAGVTLALAANLEAHRYGGVRLDDDGCVIEFVPRGTDAGGTYHFVGVQLVNANVFSGLADGRAANSVGEHYDEILRREPGSIRGIVTNAAFHDIGTVADYWKTSFRLADGARANTRPSSRISASARVTRSIVWDDVCIDDDCRVDRCIIADGVHLPKGTTLSQAIVATGPRGRMRSWPLDISFND